MSPLDLHGRASRSLCCAVVFSVALVMGSLGTTQAAAQGTDGSAGSGGAGPAAGLVAPGSVNLNALANTANAAGESRPGVEGRSEVRAAPPAKPTPSATPTRQTPSQFQRFVQESTGQWLPVYGSELFGQNSYQPDGSQPAPADYVLGSGDEVRVYIWGGVDYSGNHVIDRQGNIHLPKVGAIPLAGVAVKNLDAVLRTRVARLFTNFEVSGTVGALRSLQIYVVGQAQLPGAHTVPGMSTLVNAVFASGGPTANGSMRQIELRRGGRTLTTLDLYDFIAKGDKGRDVPLQSGDVIVIPPAGPRVAVTGAFDQAAIYELKPGGTRVGDVLGLAGGVPALASTRKAVLERIDPQQNPARQVQNLTLDKTGLQTGLRDGDILTLLNISPAFGNAVTLQGTVAAPLRHPWFEGMRVLDLIPERDALITADYYRRKNLLVQNADAAKSAGAGTNERVRNLADEINWDYAVVERLDKNRLSTTLLPFNLGKALFAKDPAHNLLLQPGDVVTVLSQSDVRLPQERRVRLVRLEGEVAAPGVYQTLPGETLPQLIARVGGLTPQAYVFGTELNRESVKALQQQNLSTLVRQLESQLQSQSTLPVGGDAVAVSQAQLVAQQQKAVVQAQLERLRSLQSNGRLALELKTDMQLGAQALPNLPLEDGDRIHIPALPGFVAAAGAVHNENVFIHTPGKTVRDILEAAGVSNDADVSATFVLRADGTVVSSRGTGRWWSGRNLNSLPLMPGDTVVVPAQLDRESRYSFITRAVKDWTQIFSNFGLGLAALKTFKSL